MSEELNNIETTVVNKYLDYQGLDILWKRIKQVFPQTANLGDILDNLADTEGNDLSFARTSYVDSKDQEIWTKIGQVESALGTNFDNQTIISGENGLQTNLILNVNSTNQTIELITKATNDNQSLLVSEISYTPFIRDSFLDGVSVIVVPDDETEADSGREPGTYLKFVFNIQDENGQKIQKEAIYLPVEDLGFKLYQGSKYITISEDDNGNNIVELNTVELDTYLEDYLSKSSAVIASIRTDIRDLSSQMTTANGKIQNLEDVVINGYTDAEGSNIPGLQTQVKQIDQKVGTYENRIVWLETNSANTVITETEINGITSDLT